MMTLCFSYQSAMGLTRVTIQRWKRSWPVAASWLGFHKQVYAICGMVESFLWLFGENYVEMGISSLIEFLVDDTFWGWYLSPPPPVTMKRLEFRTLQRCFLHQHHEKHGWTLVETEEWLFAKATLCQGTKGVCCAKKCFQKLALSLVWFAINPSTPYQKLCKFHNSTPRDVCVYR